MSRWAFLCREQSPPRYMLRRIDDPAYDTRSQHVQLTTIRLQVRRNPEATESPLARPQSTIGQLFSIAGQISRGSIAAPHSGQRWLTFPRRSYRQRGHSPLTDLYIHPLRKSPPQPEHLSVRLNGAKKRKTPKKPRKNDSGKSSVATTMFPATLAILPRVQAT
jgi:hypothetical protein